MKALSILVQLFFVFITINIKAQTYLLNEYTPRDLHCATVELDSIDRFLHPERGTVGDFEEWIAPIVEDYKTRAQSGFRAQLLTIPVVFHVITDGAGAENISAAQIHAQIDQLNIDFRNLAGSVATAAADIEIEFCLATLDPNDNLMLETGINRVTTYGGGPFTSNYIDNTVKPGTSWDPNSYMNIWSADISGGLLGWAQFPDNSGLGGMNATGGAANTDGVVALYSSIGSVANPFPGGGPYNLGRTMTHEVGHWLGLRHIWGDGACGVDDFCGDTPESDASNFGCPNHTSCSTLDMVENYMDYTDDACMDVFTADQKARMRTVMTVSPRRVSLASSGKCGVPQPIFSFTQTGTLNVNESTGCDYQDIVLDVELSAIASASSIITFTSTGTATSGGLDFEIIPSSLTFSAGITNSQSVTVRIYNDGVVEVNENINLSFTLSTVGDAIIASDGSEDYDINITDDDLDPSSAGTTVILSQDFESGLAPFTTQGNNGSDMFLIGNSLALSSSFWNTDATNTTQFAYTNDDDCNCNKANDRLRSPVFSLVGAYTTATLTFDHAFSDLINETAEVQISTGGAYTTIATLTNTSSGSPGIVTTPWIYNNIVDLTPYIGQATLQVRFKYDDDGDWAYGLAIDNVLITANGLGVDIQTAQNASQPQSILFRDSEIVHFYDVNSGNIMVSLENTSSWDFDCTTIQVDRDGTNTSSFWNSNTTQYLAGKTFFIFPVNNNINGTYNVSLYYTEAEILAWETATGKTRNDLKIVKASGPISNITSLNFNTFNIEQQVATLTAVNDGWALSASFSSGFSGFGIGDPGTPPASTLPVELLSFEANYVDDKVELNWETVTEINNDYFLVQKSIDAIKWISVGELKGSGNSNKLLSYSLEDINPFLGVSYYRLKQVDFDESFSYSEIKTVQKDKFENQFVIYPNPVNDKLFIDGYDFDKEEIRIYNGLGQLLFDVHTLKINGKLIIDVKGFNKGIYFLKTSKGIKKFYKF